MTGDISASVSVNGPQTRLAGYQQTTPKRSATLDGVRGIAILLVLAVHLYDMRVLPQDWYAVRRAAQLMSFGWAGVDLFFVLSGFLITGILLETKTAINRGVSFYGRRTLRILPLYYAIVLGCIALAVLFPNNWSVKDHWPDKTGWISYICYFQNWWMPLKEFGRAHPLGHFWSLAVEEQFYLLWPMFVWCLPKRYLLHSCMIGFFAALLLRAGLLYYGVSGWFVYENTFTRMDTLLAGAFCAILVRRGQIRSNNLRVIFALAVVGIATFLTLAYVLRNSDFYDAYVKTIGFSLLACSAGALVLGAQVSQGTKNFADAFLQMNFLKVFGKYSYGIYVYQTLIQETTMKWFSKQPWWGHSLKYAAVVSVLWLLVPFLIAFASFHLFESPFLRLKSRFTPQYVS